MKKRLIVCAILAAMITAMCGCSDNLKPVGYWTIKEIIAGDVTMTEQDIADMGLQSGFLRLNKSGSAVLNVLGDEYEGTWELAEDGTTVNVTYKTGDDSEVKGTATIEDGVLTFQDAQGSNYKMEKF